MAKDINICGVSKGCYQQPVPVIEVAGMTWEDEEYNPIEMPEKYPCSHEDHWEWGKGRRNGQKLYYPTKEMYWENWYLTDEEVNKAIEENDIFSLEMKGRIICKNCAKKIKRNENESMFL